MKRRLRLAARRRCWHLAIMLAAAPVHAAQPCAPRAAVLTQLAERYGETRQAIGVAVNGMVMELFGIMGQTHQIRLFTTLKNRHR